MDGAMIIAELGRTIGLELKLSQAGTCGVFFDEDEVIFEQHGDQLYLIADLGSNVRREDVYKRLLAANCLGQESGQATLGLDTFRGQFTVHRIVDGELSYAEFEKILALFIQAMRYWKDWLKHAESQNKSENT